MDKKYWDDFYAGKFKLDIPSQFCSLFCQEVGAGSKVIEFGCGNGRDSRVMANYGLKVLGIDSSFSAIEYCNSNKNSESLHYELMQVDALNINLLNKYCSTDTIYIYSRFFQHSITEDEQYKMMQDISILKSKKIIAYFEFRNNYDESEVKTYSGHYRRFQSIDYFINLLISNGFKINYSISGNGLSKYFDEDPNISRIICEKAVND